MFKNPTSFLKQHHDVLDEGRNQGEYNIYVSLLD